MDKQLGSLISDQVNKEFFSAYLYLGISKYFDGQNLKGFASWYKVQAAEEQEHAMKFYDYLLDNGEDVSLKAIDAVSSDYASPLDAVKAADKHEHYITDEINKIYDRAVEVKDYRAQLMLNWFITEQAEEEENSLDMINKVSMLGNDTHSLYILDKELADRK